MSRTNFTGRFAVTQQHKKTAQSYEFIKTDLINKIRESGKDITETRLFRYIENFTIKNWKFSDKNSDVFHISAQNIDCGYSLEPPRRGGSNEYHKLCFWAKIRKIMYTPVNPSFAT